MKRQLLASAGILALIAAGPASAADQAMPILKAPPAAAWSWSGFYIGGHGGYGWAKDDFTNLNDHDPFFDIFFSGKFPNFVTTGFDSKGFLGGFQAGANWQSGAVVGGLEIDLSGTGITGSKLTSPTPLITPFAQSAANWTQTDRFELLGSGRARLGYAAWPNVLFYGTGGLAWTRLEQALDDSLATLSLFPPPVTNSVSAASVTPSWRFGWVAGVGGEARISDTNWLVRLEYLHYDFGNSGSSVTSSAAAGPAFLTTGDLTLDVVRAGLSYKLDAPLVAAAGAAPGPMIFKAPARVATPWSWSGFYLGAHGGYGWGHDPFNNAVAGVPLSGIDSRGFLAGFQAGGNWQSGSVVGGLEIDLSGTDINGSTSNATSGAGTTTVASQTDKIERLGSARARLGYLATPSVLIYGTGGLAWTRLVQTADSSAFTAGAPTTTSAVATPSWQFGWVAGIGVESRLGDTNWLGRVEYLHYDFGDAGGTSEVDTAGGVVTFTSSSSLGHLTTDVVRAALSYKLDWPPASSGRGVMPVKAPVMTAWSWSGFYVGGHGGYGWGRDPFTEPFGPYPGLLLYGVGVKGFIGGGQAGANWQAGAWVGGLEIDLGTGPKGSASIATAGGGFTVTQTDKLDLLGSARARFGYLAMPGIWLYGTGGLAWTRLDETVDTLALGRGGTTAISTSTPTWQFGWVAGAGVETRLWDSNWLARAEYLHYDFGDSGDLYPATFFDGVTTFPVFPSTMSSHLTVDVVRAGVSYKLN